MVDDKSAVLRSDGAMLWSEGIVQRSEGAVQLSESAMQWSESVASRNESAVLLSESAMQRSESVASQSENAMLRNKSATPQKEGVIPRKKGVWRFAEILARNFGDLVKLNIFFCLCMLPSVAIFASGILGIIPGAMAALSLVAAFPAGGAYSACLFCVSKMLRDDPGFIWYDFRRKFAENWKQAALPGILYAALIYAEVSLLIPLLYGGGGLSVASSMMPGVAGVTPNVTESAALSAASDMIQGVASSVMPGVAGVTPSVMPGVADVASGTVSGASAVAVLSALAALVVSGMVAPYIFLIVACIDLKTFQAVKNSALISFAYIGRSLAGMLAGGIGWIAFILCWPLSLVFAPLFFVFGFTIPMLLNLMWIWPPIDAQFSIEETLRR